jgi:hypothetical protein
MVLSMNTVLIRLRETDALRVEHSVLVDPIVVGVAPQFLECTSAPSTACFEREGTAAGVDIGLKIKYSQYYRRGQLRKTRSFLTGPMTLKSLLG